VVSSRVVEVVVSLALLALAGLLAFDNWRTGIGWDSTGPQPGYFPFYLAAILGGACVFGVIKELVARKRQGAAESAAFVEREQLGRVAQVFVPTLAFCLLTEWLGIYVASFFLVAGFMVFVGRIAWWKAILTAFLFAAVMFVTFDVAFDVIMPKGPLEAAFGR